MRDPKPAAEQPGGQAAMRSFEIIYRMIEQYGEQQPAIGDMTPEEIERELEGLVAEMVREKPEIAVAFLEEAGWTVIPPVRP